MQCFYYCSDVTVFGVFTVVSAYSVLFAGCTVVLVVVIAVCMLHLLLLLCLLCSLWLLSSVFRCFLLSVVVSVRVYVSLLLFVLIRIMCVVVGVVTGCSVCLCV